LDEWNGEALAAIRFFRPSSAWSDEEQHAFAELAFTERAMFVRPMDRDTLRRVEQRLDFLRRHGADFHPTKQRA